MGYMSGTKFKTVSSLATIVVISSLFAGQVLAQKLDVKSVIQADLKGRVIDAKEEPIQLRVRDFIYSACGVYPKKSFEISKIDIEVSNFSEGSALRLFTASPLSEITRGYSGTTRNGFITLEDSSIISGDDNIVEITGSMTLKRALMTVKLDDGCNSINAGAGPADKAPPSIARPVEAPRNSEQKPQGSGSQKQPQAETKKQTQPQAQPQAETKKQTQPQMQPQARPSRPPTRLIPPTEQPQRQQQPEIQRPQPQMRPQGQTQTNSQPRMAETRDQITVDFYPGEMVAVYVNDRYHLTDAESFDPVFGVIT
jgi:hypothetical protein